jgi:ATP-dependent DNA ligase
MTRCRPGRGRNAGKSARGFAVTSRSLARSSSPLSAPPPRETRFGSPLVLSRVHWVKPQLVAEMTYLTRTEDGLLRQTVYMGLRSDKPAAEVRRKLPR